MTQYKDILMKQMEMINLAMTSHTGFNYTREGLEKALQVEISNRGKDNFDWHVGSKINNPYALSIYAGEIVYKHAPTCATRD